MSAATEVADLLRELAPQVLGALVRRYGRFDACEDAMQEALLAAALQWPAEGLPGNPKGWLITVASRRRIELLRNDSARRRREETAAALAPPDPEPIPAVDDTLTLVVLCCHPSLTPVSQVVPRPGQPERFPPERFLGKEPNPAPGCLSAAVRAGAWGRYSPSDADRSWGRALARTPAPAARGPAHTMRRGMTLAPSRAGRVIIDAIDGER